MNSTSLHILQFADYHDSVLRKSTERVTFPLSEEDKRYIADMIYSIQSEQLKKADAPFHSAAGMAANQWGIHKQIFLFCPDGDTINGLEVIINPAYQPLAHSQEDIEWEACFSVPLATGNIKRFTHIRITYDNEAGEHITKELQGWHARVWQHENDHLNGYLYDDPRTGKCIEKINFASRLELETFFSKKRAARNTSQS